MPDNQTCISLKDIAAVWTGIDDLTFQVDNFVDNQRTAIITVLLASVMEGMST